MSCIEHMTHVLSKDLRILPAVMMAIETIPEFDGKPVVERLVSIGYGICLLRLKEVRPDLMQIMGEKVDEETMHSVGDMIREIMKKKHKETPDEDTRNGTL